ncbi:MAG: AI-2E family transporter [Flavobacteriales bacterium]|jgi:predicted PurR-regulated permease PerM|nr:AI-2E family transporter [Flavobacteriales bacterium]
METNKYTFDRVVRIIITLLVITGLYLLLDRLSGVLIPFFIAIFLAYYMNPLVLFFQRKTKKRGLSILLSFLSTTIVSTLVLMLLIPLISGEIASLEPMMNKFLAKDSIKGLEGVPNIIEDFIVEYKDEPQIKKFLSSIDFQSILMEVTNSVTDVLGFSLRFVMGLFTIFIVLLYWVFILVDYPSFANDWGKLIPPKYRITLIRFVKDFQEAMDGYFKGQALVALSVGILFAIGFSIIGLPMAILFGLFVGALNMIPYMQLASIPPALFLALLQSVDGDQSFVYCAILVLVVYAIVQIIQDAVIVPKIMGNITSMNPAIILLSLSVWGSLLGVIGMIIAIPITSLIISYYKSFIHGLNENNGKEK